ncbi:LLM class flavin-dependent oxidoreductase [Actinoallomurus sp. CA-142502]|uniref:LLM class flavin-dependent oxidoreductase n=1 Tax=Actinoallomurus sp. CA-142502 TaxID=3239885 RepID=UPI003D91F677
MTVKVDIRVPVGRPLREVADFIARCEDAGFNGVGVHDHHHTGRDVYVALALAAERTSRLTLYPATSNAVTRHPLVLAALSNSVAELAPGRFLLSLAPGFLSVERAGEPQARRAHLRETVRTVRFLLRGESTPLGARETVLTHPVTPPPEVFVLAAGPRMLELAGEVADGVMMFVGLHPDAVRVAREHVATGARRAGRDPASIKEIFIVTTAVGPFEEVREWPRREFREGQSFLTYPSKANLRWLREAGIDLADDHRPGDIPPELATEICDAFGLFGPAEYCAERLLRAREEIGRGDDLHVFFFPAHTFASGYDLPEKDVAAFAETIGPRLAGS